MNVVTIRRGLATACGTITGLTGKDFIPEQINNATAVVNPDDTHSRGGDQFITYNDANAKGLTTLRFEIVLLVPIANGLERAQNTLDGYLSAGSGATTSAVDAINSATITGADCQLVEAARKYGVVNAGGTECATAALAVTVYAPRR